MPLWPCQSDYPLRFLSTGQSVGYLEYAYESQSAPFGFPGTQGDAHMCICIYAYAFILWHNNINAMP